MRNYNFDEVIDRHGTRSTKWDMGEMLLQYHMAERFDKDTISAFTADMDFACAPAIIAGMKRIVEQQIYGYTQPGADGAYTKAIIHWHKKRYDWTIKEEQIVYVNGTLNAINEAIYAFTKEGDGIVIQKPVYEPFEMLIRGSRRQIINNPLQNVDGYYTMDFADLEEKLSNPRNTMMILCNPHNPVGRVWTEEEQQKVCDLCEKYQVLLVADEIHADLVRKNVQMIPVGKIASGCKKIICTGINKSFNVAGLQCTNVIIEDPEMCEKYRQDMMDRVGPVMPTPFAIEAVIQAYEHSEDWLDELNTYLDESMDYVEAFLKEYLPKVKFRKPEGTYIIWMDFGAYGTNEEVMRRLSANANLVLDPGTKYGEDRYVRACIPVPHSILAEMFRRIHREFG